MALIFDRTHAGEPANPTTQRVHEPADGVGLSLILAMSERALLESSARVAGELFDVVEPGTKVTLATGTTYYFDEVFGILFRDGTPLNLGRFGRGPAGPFDDINLVTAGRAEALAFFAELPTLIEEFLVAPADSEDHETGVR